MIDFSAGGRPAVDLVAALLPQGLAISVVTYLEIVEGILGSRDPLVGTQDFRRFLQGVPVLSISEAVANRAAAIRLERRRQKRQVNERALDILIAATAIEHDLTLVTRNVRDDEDVPGLRISTAAPTKDDRE